MVYIVNHGEYLYLSDARASPELNARKHSSMHSESRADSDSFPKAKLIRCVELALSPQKTDEARRIEAPRAS